ncbi:Iron/ascorbate family oxidoreductase [Handroanthus impetiginosus]|uniref:Iron/ascorbate family oxidoreductase n=1 Tax=Handroanthus impetiginosus TaxID=429701 RepID=A0A2G9G3V2_9LAMI|nr:Iron/ascorbate family oxidoreductase [Handroanthus impetiginosus]
MAATTPPLRQDSPAITCVKKLAETPNLNSIPSNYAYYTTPTEATASDPDDSIPTIDLCLLTSNDPHQKSKAVQELGKACQDWGFFMIVNHGIPEALMKAILEATDEFFNLPEEEKPEFEPKNVLEPIRYGTSFNTAKEKVFCWRDFLKVFVLELLPEYCERTRDVVRKLLKGISESLDLEEGEIGRALDLESSLQIFVANYYPRCPNPDVAVGLVPHSDHGLLTILIQNKGGGLQIQHQGKWIFSNGKYKSVLHRAVVNNEKTRISIAMANGPSLEAVVCPPSKLVQNEGGIRSYVPMKYKDYLRSHQCNQLNGKAMLKRVQIQD